MICKIIGHKWLCDFTDQQHPELLLQFFQCKRCGKQMAYCGFIKKSVLMGEVDNNG